MANSGPVVAEGEPDRVFFFVSGFGSGAYSAKLFTGTRHVDQRAADFAVAEVLDLGPLWVLAVDAGVVWNLHHRSISGLTVCSIAGTCTWCPR
jgi:hypothetical protein